MYSVVQKICRYWNTLRHLKLVQIVGRIQHRLLKVRVDQSIFQGKKRALSIHWVQPALRSRRMIERNTFCFLNEKHEVVNKGDWNNEKYSKLWLYNLHYFDDLTAIDAGRRIVWHSDFIHRWVRENPPGMGNGWEAYPLSLRIVNWIKWSLSGNQLNAASLHSLVVQTRFLSKTIEVYLLGNHLFANAKALLFVGLFFEGDEAQSWYDIGRSIIEKELLEQVLEDGGNFELSTMYHLIFLEDLLDLVNIQRTFSSKPLRAIEDAIPKMIYWLINMCHPDGEISFFNDAALGITPSVEELFRYAERLGFRLHTEPSLGIVDLSASGYSRVSLGNNVVVLIDRAAIGPDYLPAHAHADSLSFELSIFGQRVIVNSGTSVYGNGRERQRQRGTGAHSTIVIDGVNSSDVWGGFRVGRRARVSLHESYELSKNFFLSACHDGYKHLSGKPIHKRDWFISKSLVEIKDFISGSGFHDIEATFPLHPSVEIVNITRNSAILYVDGKQIKVLFFGLGVLAQEKSTYHPEFGLTVYNYKLVYRLSARLPINIITRIYW